MAVQGKLVTVTIKSQESEHVVEGVLTTNCFYPLERRSYDKHSVPLDCISVTVENMKAARLVEFNTRSKTIIRELDYEQQT